MSTEHRLLIGSVAMFLVLSVAYVFSISLPASAGASITGDEPFYLLTTQSLLQDGDLDLTQQYQSHSYRDFFEHPHGLWQQSIPNEDGVLLSPHNPGLSVLLIPGFVAAGLLGAQVQLLLLAALTFALTYVLAVRVTGEVLWSWCSVAIVGLSASAFVYSTEVYPELPAALMLIGALLLMQSSTLKEGSPKVQIGFWRVSLLVFLLSGLAWLGVKYLPLAGLVALWGFWRMNRGDRTVLVTLGVISGAFFAWFHLNIFGALTPYSVGVVYAGDSSLSVLDQHLAVTDRVYRLVGLFVDQRFGVGRWAPVLLLAVPALVFLWRRGGMGRLVLALVTVQVLIATFMAVTMMGWWFPGRTLMVVFPLLVLPLALLLARLNSWGRLAVGMLAVYSMAATVALALAAHSGGIYLAVNPFDMTAPIFQAVAPIFPDYSYWDAQTWWLTVGWLALAAGGLAAAILSVGSKSLQPGSFKLKHRSQPAPTA